MEKLTRKQTKILNLIKDEIKLKGIPPSIREICNAMGLSSTATVHEHLKRLEQKGYINRCPSKTRNIEILEKNFYTSNIELENIPILGTVTAGMPILAIENIEGYFPIPINYLKNNKSFMLKIKGDSMINAGIFDKDLVLVNQQNNAENNDIVIALIEDCATCKRLFKEKNGYIRLQPENNAFMPIILKEVKILGKVIGLFRTGI